MQAAHPPPCYPSSFLYITTLCSLLEIREWLSSSQRNIGRQQQLLVAQVLPLPLPLPLLLPLPLPLLPLLPPPLSSTILPIRVC